MQRLLVPALACATFSLAALPPTAVDPGDCDLIDGVRDATACRKAFDQQAKFADRSFKPCFPFEVR